MVFGLFRRRNDEPIVDLYIAVVAQARAPRFYADLAVPDTIEGRFEMMVVHCGLVVARLGRDPATRETGTRLAEIFFDDMDRTLRETGVGDISVPKKVRKLASAFYGRLTAYETAGGGPALAEAVSRNIYDGRAPEGAAEALAAYIGAAAAALAATDASAVATGTLPWPPIPGPTGGTDNEGSTS